METDPQLAPSVVSVMVVYEPGEWFDQTLESLAAQDYPNLRTLFLIASDRDGDGHEIATRIRSAIPSAFTRFVPLDAAFAPAVNEVLRLVEGDNGFFLVCHDDIALEPTALRSMVAEMFRSNAGVVGPKLVDWDEPRTLQHVGLGLDRFGEADPVVDLGELDQEQHDAVRDVFVLPSACVLVRADLFRALGGFDPNLSFHGEDVDLCWRAHLTGARVIVVPDARVRHRERLVERRPDLNHRALRARHRMRAVATLTGGSRLVGRSIQLVLLTLVELIVGLFTGRFGEALASARALIGLIPRTGSILRRRSAIRGQRVVPEREVLGLQDAGSSRLTSYLRGRETTTFVGAESPVRRWREASFGPVLAWFAVVLAVLVGSRSFIRDGVPPVGEFLPYPRSPSQLWSHYRGSFDGRSFGSTAAVPTGWALLVAGSFVAFFRMSFMLTASIVGLYLAGALGSWRLATVFPVNRARIAGMVVYVGSPLVPGVLSRGDWSALVWYAALPWSVHLLRRAAGLEAADPAAADLDFADGVAKIGIRDRARPIAILTLVVASAAAFVPVVVALWAVVGLLIAVATLVAGGSWRVAAWLAGFTLLSCLFAVGLNLPWALDWSWDTVTATPLAGSTGRGLAEVATLAPDEQRFAILAIGLYLPLVAAVAITRAWRLTWGVRGGALVLVFGALLLFVERGAIRTSLPASSLLAVPIALGLALGAASIVGGFGSDVMGRGFGWRQPLALAANAALVIGLVPGAISIGQGAWHTPTTPMPRLLAAQLPLDPDAGDYRVLYVGDPRVLPVPARAYRDGIGWAVTDAGPLDFTDRFTVPETTADAAIARALDLVASGSTLRVGRILAPLGIRYIVVPKFDGVVSTVDAPVAVPAGLVASLQSQLDIGPIPGQPSLEVFLNQSWIPVGAQLSGTTAEASLLAGEDSLVRADLTQAVPSMFGADATPEGANEVAPGVVHIAIPFDDRIQLSVDGDPVTPRAGFGVTTAFDVASAGVGVLHYERDTTRGWWLASQGVLWLLVVVVAAGAHAPFARRRSLVVHDETLIDLGDAPIVTAGVSGEMLGLRGWPDGDDLGGMLGSASEVPEIGGDGDAGVVVPSGRHAPDVSDAGRSGPSPRGSTPPAGGQVDAPTDPIDRDEPDHAAPAPGPDEPGASGAGVTNGSGDRRQPSGDQAEVPEAEPRPPVDHDELDREGR